MVYAYDQEVQLPIMSLYDTQMMLSQISAAKDMYEKAAQEMKDFKKEYGDFYSPFSKDMQRYSETVGNVQKTVQGLYDKGIDPLRSVEGRMAVRQAMNSIDIGEYSAMKANAKLGYAYLDAMQKLRQSGKYSEAQEIFDILQNGGTKFSDFATTRNSDGSFTMWDRVSPIEATTLRDLTYKNYEHRTPRDLTAEDFKNDPTLKGVTFDPRYQYTGYLDSDLMKVAPGASASLVGDPRAAFFRDQARQKVAASGQPVTDEAVEAQFQRDIADANKWALVDPTKKVDEYAMQAQRTADAIRLEGIRAKNDENIARIKASTNGGDGSGSYFTIISNAASSKLTAHKLNMLSDIDVKNYQEANKIKDPVARQAAISKLDNDVWKNYIYKDRPGGSIADRIQKLKPGQNGVGTLNDILSFRAVGGSAIGDATYILPESGFIPDGDGWFKTTGDSKIVTAHQLVKNILQFEAPSELQDKSKLIDKINDVENDDDLWINATTKERARRTKAVRPETSKGNGYIVAPDENGINRVYMRVSIKQGAQGWDLGSWMPQGEHGGYWVETNIIQNPNGTISLESVPTQYMQEAQERHDLSNAGVTQSYTDARF